MKLSDLPPSVRPAVACQLHAVPQTPRPPRTDPYRSQLERDYAGHLAMLQAAGEVTWWEYEPMTLNLGGGAKYKPDFVVLKFLPWSPSRNPELQIHETKGFMREAANVRLKVAAGKYPFPFFLVRRDAGGWKAERVGG